MSDRGPGRGIKKSADLFYADQTSKWNSIFNLRACAWENVGMLSSIFYILTKEARHEKRTEQTRI